MNKRKRAIIIIILFMVISAITSVKWKYDTDKVFDVNKWEQQVEDRHKMIDSLIYQYGIIGMNGQELKTLLGSNAIYQDNDQTLSYFIAPGVGDPVIFEVRFDGDGKAVSYSKYES